MQSKDFKVIERQNTCLEKSDQTKQGRLWRRLLRLEPVPAESQLTWTPTAYLKKL